MAIERKTPLRRPGGQPDGPEIAKTRKRKVLKGGRGKNKNDGWSGEEDILPTCTAQGTA